ncbi:hypothetical protein B0H10DRAFT_1971782 [Mycena sp. CBHHK59/15]|nr:hypothetical protein B0H10DRAFT_1971782 [Mycena sp. CBHHK59/15]
MNRLLTILIYIYIHTGFASLARISHVTLRAIWGNTAICARRCNPGWRAGLHYFTLTSGVRISITDRRPHSLDVPAVSDGFGDAGGFLDDFTVLSSVKLKMRSSRARHTPTADLTRRREPDQRTTQIQATCGESIPWQALSRRLSFARIGSAVQIQGRIIGLSQTRDGLGRLINIFIRDHGVRLSAAASDFRVGLRNEEFEVETKVHFPGILGRTSRYET